MKKILYLLLLVVSTEILAQSSYGSLTGRVLDKTTLEPLPGVNVILLLNGADSATDIDGKFRIENIPVGSYQVKASYVGYDSQIFQS